MSILGTCPACGEAGPLEMFLHDAQARAALGAALRLPAELADLIPAYLALHAPPPSPGGKRRRLDPGKLARLLETLSALIHAGTVTRNRDTRAAPLPAWADGLRAVLVARDKGGLTLPLDGHGLLCEIVYSRAGRQAAADPAPLHPSHLPASAPERSLRTIESSQGNSVLATQRGPRPAPVQVGALLAGLRPGRAADPGEDSP